MTGGAFSGLQPLDATLLPPAPPGVTFPYGAFGFTVVNVTPGASITLDIATPEGVRAYWKLVDGTWLRLSNAQLLPGGIRVTLTDGGFGDADGVANGVIVDPAALGVGDPVGLEFSTRRDRSAATSLSGATVSAPIAIFVPDDQTIRRVEFFLDDPLMDGSPRQVERFSPYDFAGTAGDGRARLFSTRTLTDGAHSVTARIVRRDGTVDVVTADFVVDNPRPTSRVLTVSSTARRTNPLPLDGATISRPVAVFVPSEPDISSVKFAVDGVERSVERFAEYDLGTTNPNGRARLVIFPPGPHTVTATVRFDDGFVDTLTAEFTVGPPT